MEYKEIIELTSYWSVIVAAVVTVLLASLAYGQWRKEYIGKKSINFGLELLQQVLRARYVFKWCLTGIVYADEYSDRPIGSEQEEETVGDRQIRDRAWAIVKRLNQNEKVFIDLSTMKIEAEIHFSENVVIHIEEIETIVQTTKRSASEICTALFNSNVLKKEWKSKL